MFESNSTRIGGSSSNDLEGQGHKAKCIPEKRSLTKPSTSLSVQSNSIGDPMEVLCMIRLFYVFSMSFGVTRLGKCMMGLG